LSSHAGAAAEAAAAAHLEREGYRIIAKNVRAPGGEIDLVAEQGGVLCFVEVRMRTHDAHGSAEESVDLRKQRRVIAAARHYLARHPPRGACRFDVVAVEPGAPPRCRVLVDAFRDESPL
jgi:putative endonuclease